MKNIITSLFLICSITILQAQNQIEASEIMKKVKANESIHYANTIIKGDLDFTFLEETLPTLPKKNKWIKLYKDNSVVKDIENTITFENCTFKGNVLGYIPHKKSGFTFIAHFEDDIAFKNCTFEKKAMFKYTDFHKTCDFSGSKFEDDTTFKYARFLGNASFTNTNFSEPATFKYANFKKFVSFKNSVFEEQATFKYTNFKKGLSFNNVKFQEDLDIKYTNIKGDFDIINMDVTFDIIAKYTSINGKSFNKFLLKAPK